MVNVEIWTAKVHNKIRNRSGAVRWGVLLRSYELRPLFVDIPRGNVGWFVMLEPGR